MFAVLTVTIASADRNGPALRTGTYSLDFLKIRQTTLRNERGDPQRSCGNESRAVYDSLPRLEVVFDAATRTAVVNGDEWVVMENSTGLYAGRSLTACTWLAVKLTSRPAGKASGGLLYSARCAERECADFADYRGTFAAP